MIKAGKKIWKSMTEKNGFKILNPFLAKNIQMNLAIK